MNYTVKVVLAPLLLLFSACFVTQEIVNPRQELIKVSPLPSSTVASASTEELKLRVLFRVLHDGAVAEVRLLKPSANQQWDSAVVDVMKQWRFSPSSYDTASDGHWHHYLFDLHVGEPIVLTLGELVAAGQQEADSLYELLNNGVSFTSVAMHCVPGSSNERGKFLGLVSIETYPERVRNELRKLRLNDFTHPIRLGKEYVIFMRFEDTENLPQ